MTIEAINDYEQEMGSPHITKESPREKKLKIMLEAFLKIYNFWNIIFFLLPRDVCQNE